MTRVALDSNVLLYAELDPQSSKGQRASALVLAALRDGVIAMQVFGEMLRVVQREDLARIEGALVQIEKYARTFIVPLTSLEILANAGRLARQHRLQTWDAIIIVASASAGAHVLLSEDMQDGQIIGGLRILNPFNSANDAEIDTLFAP